MASDLCQLTSHLFYAWLQTTAMAAQWVKQDHIIYKKQEMNPEHFQMETFSRCLDFSLTRVMHRTDD